MIASIILASLFKAVTWGIVCFGGIIALMFTTLMALLRDRPPISLHDVYDREHTRRRTAITEYGDDPRVVGDVSFPPQQAKYPGA